MHAERYTQQVALPLSILRASLRRHGLARRRADGTRWHRHEFIYRNDTRHNPVD
jgi:hypothetical protein